MIKRLFPITAAALLLVGCSAPDQPAETSTVETTSSSATSSATSSMTRVPSTTAEVPPTEEPTPTIEPAASTGDYYPGDPRLTPVNTLSDTMGVFLASDVTDTSGKYYVFCNGGHMTLADGAPVESGTCTDLLTWDEVTTIAATFSDILTTAIDTVFEELDAELESEFEEAGYPYYSDKTESQNSDDIAAGIAEDMGCESAVFNEEIQGYEYVGCQ